MGKPQPMNYSEYFHNKIFTLVNPPGGSAIKTPPVMQETWVQSLGQEDSLEKEMATHSSILAWEISWMEEPGGLQSMGITRVRQDSD